MKRKYFFLLFFYTFFYNHLFSQSNESDFDFLTKTVKRNYPGFSKKTDSLKYEKFVYSLKKRNDKDEFEKMSELLLFFNDKHLVVYDVEPKKRFDSIYCKKNHEKTIAYLSNAKLKKDRYEGYWISDYNDCIMGIVKSSNSPVVYTGTVIETTSDIPKGFPICLMYSKTSKGFLTNYTDHNTIYSEFLYSKFTEANTLITGSYNRWSKLTSKDPRMNMLTSLTNQNFDPSFNVIEKSTVVFKVPAMDGYFATKVDSVIKANDSIIRETPILIIDVRNNIGGTSRTYFPLFPYIYTDSIIRQSSSVFCSESYIEYVTKNIEKIKQKGDTSGLKNEEDNLRNLMSNKGKYIFKPSPIVKFDSVLTYPKNVAVLINYACLSATELMLLDFMQSKKVKFFGETTGGAVDYLSFFPIKTPSKRYTIYMPSVIREGIGGKLLPLDNSGIEPHVPIKNKSVDWIHFVKKYYEDSL